MGNKLQAFQEFLTTETVKVPLGEFILNLAITFLLAYLLQYIYINYARSLSNRKRFASTFTTLALTTMIIITVVKSSLALSLGLVGALSIVRFRTAIKDPEELAYVFMTIAIGLGMGAGQTAITVVGFAVLVSAVVLRTYRQKSEENKNLFLTISGNRDESFDLSQLASLLRQHCLSVDLKRLDESRDEMEAIFVVEFDDFDKLQDARSGISTLNPSYRMTLLDNGVI